MGRRHPREHPVGESPGGGERGKPSVIRRVVTALLLAALVAGCGKDSGPRSQGASGSSSASPSVGVGAEGAGDPYFADLGNGGYDVTHYDLELRIDPQANRIDGVATIDAKATQDLAQFDLDLLGLQVSSVTVGGADAAFSRHDRELVVTPAAPATTGSSFTTVVTYSGTPEPRSTKALPIAVGWISTGDGSFMINEPEGASTWYPVNDHPSDKATYTFHLTVPDGVTAVANGMLSDKASDGNGHTTWTYEPKAPMASYLTEVAVGDFQVTTAPGPDGVTIRNVFASPLAADAAVDFSRQPDMLSFFASEFGPYPFDVYGALVVDERTQFALETQTLSLFDSAEINGNANDDTTAAHELAHQWFGDSVTPETWKDVWLNEGFATYAEWMWTEHVGGPSVAVTAQRVHDDLSSSGAGLAGDPGVDKLFSYPTVYERGALTLQALRLTVGDDTFFTTLRTYASRFAGRNATTEDFVSVANDVAGRDLHDLFDQWLYRAPVPALPAS